MLKQSRFVLLTSLLLVTLGGVSSARTHVSVMAGAVRLPAVSGAIFETDRDRDGLSGPVRRIKTETAKLVPKDGQMVEATRQTLETATYDMKGAKIDYAFFPTATDSLTGKEVYKYDDKGNIAEMTLLTTDGLVLSKETYQYEFDKLGNWIKMTTLVAVVENGQMVFEPKEITYRSITYYLEDSVAKAMQGGLNAQTLAGTTMAANTAIPAPAAAKPSLTTVKMEVASNSAPSNVPAANNNAAANIATKQTPAMTTNPSSSNNNTAAANASVTKKQTPAAAAVVTAPDASPITTNLSTSTNLTLKSLEPTAAMTSSSAAAVKTEEGPAPPSKPLRGTPVKPISGGVLNGKAVELPKPDYPEMARRSRTAGMVTVEVVIDVTGKVISANAISGPSMLQRAAEVAALKARFTPTLLSGQPVKMTGTINYKFAL